jgi:hypothetical protein
MNSFCPSKTIDEVIEQLNAVIKRCIQDKSRIGYFAVLYRDVTVQVREMIERREFQDNERMERLDVVFANRFLEAIHQYWNDEKPSKSWLVAFETSKSTSPMILQHLLLGMNAHINLDLAIATTQVAPGDLLPKIKADFNKIMDLLSSMIEGVQERLELVSPYIKLIDKIGGKTDEKIAGFAVNKARDLAWLTAGKLVKESPADFARNYVVHDELVSILAKVISRPGLVTRTVFWLIKMKESKDVVKVIKTLEAKK